jgi:hypothetical protein
MKLGRKRLDSTVLAALDLQPGEHVLAWADDGAGRLVVATETALHLQRTPPDYTRLGWETIERASYQDGLLTVFLTGEDASRSLRIPLGEDTKLPIVVRDRVTASVVVDRLVTLTGNLGVRVVGRRAPRSDHVVWRVEPDPGLPDTSEIREASDQALADIKAEVGGI